MKKATVSVLVTAAFASGAVAQAAGGWRTFASSSDKGDYGTYASANASVQSPNALAVRASGKSDKPFEVSWYATCEGVAQARSGQVITISVPAAAKCSLNGSVSGGSGTARVELLRR